MDLSFLMVFLKKYFVNPAKRQNFDDALGQTFYMTWDCIVREAIIKEKTEFCEKIIKADLPPAMGFVSTLTPLTSKVIGSNKEIYTDRDVHGSQGWVELFGSAWQVATFIAAASWLGAQLHMYELAKPFSPIFSIFSNRNPRY